MHSNGHELFQLNVQHSAVISNPVYVVRISMSYQRRLDKLYAQLKIILFNLLFPDYHEFYITAILNQSNQYIDYYSAREG